MPIVSSCPGSCASISSSSSPRTAAMTAHLTWCWGSSHRLTVSVQPAHCTGPWRQVSRWALAASTRITASQPRIRFSQTIWIQFVHILCAPRVCVCVRACARVCGYWCGVGAWVRMCVLEWLCNMPTLGRLYSRYSYMDVINALLGESGQLIKP